MSTAVVSRPLCRVVAPQALSPDAAFREQLARALPELRARAMHLCGDPSTAEDLVQDAAERALRFAAQFDRGTNLRAWASQILFSVFVTQWRRRRRERRALANLAVDPVAWPTPVPPTGPDAGPGALSPSMRRHLDALPEGFRDTLVLVIVHGRSYRDAARELGIPVGTVMSRLHRARRLLAAEVERAGGERQAA
ncbi:MAG TPA: RNA polymerase sigma factor [Polyangiaceae bacterium]|nr:RNA polymerase sigma factor [Polyangiaceae bacterium]